jgi:hypothetical protein
VKNKNNDELKMGQGIEVSRGNLKILKIPLTNSNELVSFLRIFRKHF